MSTPEFEFTLGNPGAGSASNKRIPVVLCLDTSSSMDQVVGTASNDSKPFRRIDQLNAALAHWKSELSAVAQIRRQADLCIISFNTEPTTEDIGGGVNPGFVTVERFSPPTLKAGGVTRLDLAVRSALAKATEHRVLTHIETHRPKIWIISDGQPTDGKGNPSDNWHSVLPDIRNGESKGDFAVYAAGVYGADMEALGKLAGRGAFDLEGLELALVLKAVTSTMGHSGSSVADEKKEVAATVDKMQRLFQALGKD